MHKNCRFTVSHAHGDLNDLIGVLKKGLLIKRSCSLAQVNVCCFPAVLLCSWQCGSCLFMSVQSVQAPQLNYRATLLLLVINFLLSSEDELLEDVEECKQQEDFVV